MPAPSPAASATPGVQTPTQPKAKKAKGGRKLLWIFIALIVLGGGGGGWWWWQHKQAAAHAANKTPVSKARAQAQYYALEPAFVVNLTDEESVRYLQADLQLMTRDSDTLAAFALHAPAIRNRLLLLFGQQSAAQLAQRSGKERLQEAALTEVRKLLKGEGAPDKIEAVIFTSLVTQ
ncbi:MAG: flagellar basal body-associated FliL family protein [Burkholderiaceae bacterium]